MKTPPNSVRTIDPVGHASRQPASSQCLQTSEEKVHEVGSAALPPKPGTGGCSTNFTWRQVEAPTAPVLSYENPLQSKPSWSTPFHSLQATSQALQPMHNVESVRNAVTLMRSLLSCIYSGVRVHLLQCCFATSTAPRHHIADQGFGFHDADVGLFADHEQVVDDVPRHLPAIAPMVGESDNDLLVISE